MDPLVLTGNALLLLLFVNLVIILVIRVHEDVISEQKFPERGCGIVGLLLVKLLRINKLLGNDVSLLGEILRAQSRLEILFQVKRLAVERSYGRVPAPEGGETNKDGLGLGRLVQTEKDSGEGKVVKELLVIVEGKSIEGSTGEGFGSVGDELGQNLVADALEASVRVLDAIDGIFHGLLVVAISLDLAH